MTALLAYVTGEEQTPKLAPRVVGRIATNEQSAELLRLADADGLDLEHLDRVNLAASIHRGVLLPGRHAS